MASTFSCIGLGVESREAFGELVARLGAASEVTSTNGGITVHHWVDPSGAMVGLAIDERNDLAELFPTLDPAGAFGVPSPGSEPRPGATLGSLAFPHAPIVTAAVLADGEQVSALGFASEGWWRLSALPHSPAEPVSAHVVALGTAMVAYPDAAAFAASQGPSPRLADESFIPGGLFASPPTADALLTGTVLAAERRTNTLTGQDFVVAGVRTVGFTATVCLPGSDHPELPVVGGILSGGTVMTASLVLA